MNDSEQDDLDGLIQDHDDNKACSVHGVRVIRHPETGGIALIPMPMASADAWEKQVQRTMAWQDHNRKRLPDIDPTAKGTAGGKPIEDEAPTVKGKKKSKAPTRSSTQIVITR